MVLSMDAPWITERRGTAAASKAAPAPARGACALARAAAPSLQSADPDVLSDWPAALHLLGHIYNGNL
jgi:hypothetical protein